MKSPSQRGVIGAWAYQARQELGLSVEQVAARVSDAGQQVSPATIRGIEAGTKKPAARLLRLLAQALESTAPGHEPETQQPGPSLDVARLFDAFAQALEVQARYLTQIEDLRTEMAEARRTAEEGREEQARLIGHLSDQLDELRGLVETRAGSGSRGPAGQG